VTWVAKEIQTTFDGVFVWNHANSSAWLPVMCDKDIDVVEHDEIGFIAYASNTSLVPNATVEAYYIYKDNDKVAATGNDAVLHTFGMRIAGGVGENWKYRLELAPQVGRKNSTHVCAFGLNSQVAYFFKDRMNSHARVGYEYRSGDSHIDGAFDILWGRYPQWSEAFNGYIDTLEGPPAMSTNFHRFNIGVTCSPMENMTVALDYHLLWADRGTVAGLNTPSAIGGDCFRGQLITALLRYQFNAYLSTHLICEAFIPGSFYNKSNNDPSVFARWEVVLSW